MTCRKSQVCSPPSTKMLVGAKVMVQPIKHLSCKPEGLSLGPSNPSKKLGIMVNVSLNGRQTDPGHPNTYPIYELLEHVKGWILQNQGCRISMTQQQQVIREECQWGLQCSRSRRLRSKPMNHCKKYLQVKLSGQRVILWDAPQFPWQDFFHFFIFLFSTFFWGRLQGKKANMEGLGN